MKQRQKKRLRRAESFLGLHFDFHASDDCTEVGKKVNSKMVRQIIRQIQPDYIQCDSKGHPGLSSYPTTVGYPAPGFVRDPLRIWRNVTARYGVALYAHYCGIWSAESVRRHRSWAIVRENGKPDHILNSVFGPYLQKQMIPQLKELNDRYAIDGIWVDGDCWAAAHDYHKRVLREFRRATGIRNLPRRPEDPHFFEFTEFCREGFRRYLDSYVTALHKHNPRLQLCCNWAYSSFMPEPVGIEVDFLSGDYPSLNSVNMARFEARCLVHQGKPWDLMAWSFAYHAADETINLKSVPQMQQEAAVTLALGGGLSFYQYQQQRDGSVTMWEMKPLVEVFKFCRQRQPFCHRARPVPQIALLLSGYSYYRRNPRLFCPRDPFAAPADTDILTPTRGILNCLLESQQVVDITMEHHLKEHMQNYPLIIIPECDQLNPKLRTDLSAYVNNGGHVLVIGSQAAYNFRKELAVTFHDYPQAKKVWLHYDGSLFACHVTQYVKLTKRSRQFSQLFEKNDMVGPSTPAASITRYGKGKIAGVYINMGESYTLRATPTLRHFLHGLVRELFADPIVEVTGSQYVDVTLNRLDNHLAVNLVNTAGPHGDDKIHVFDEIPVIGPLHIRIRTKTRPRKVTLEPDHQPLKYRFSQGTTLLQLDRLAIHSVIVCELPPV